MKKIIPIFIIFSLVSTGMAWPFSKKEPKPSPTPVVVSTPSVTSKPTIQDGRQLVREIGIELKAAKEENARLKTSLEKATEQVKKAETRTIEVQRQADALKEWGILQQAEAHRFMERYNNAVKRYHRLKTIASIIAAAAGVFLGLQFMRLVPPPYNLLVPIGGAGLFASLVWFFL
jgi:hypothetical protein